MRAFHVKSCSAAMRSVKTTVTPMTNSGLIFGPPLSVSKKRIMPIEELGPESVRVAVLNFMQDCGVEKVYIAKRATQELPAVNKDRYLSACHYILF